MDIQLKIKKEVFNDAYLNYLDNNDRYLIFYGGAGSGKSVFIAQRYIYKMLKHGLVNILVVRQTANSNRDSTFALLKQMIYKWKLTDYFKINEADMRIVCKVNKNTIIFRGLEDVERLKSITFQKGELSDIWVEEASETEEKDIQQLDVRLRGLSILPKQMVLSFNPVDINSFLKKKYFDKKLDNCTILHTTYKDNKFLDEAYKKLLESYKETDPYYYDVYCLNISGQLKLS